jgi:hypothetical protein
MTGLATLLSEDYDHLNPVHFVEITHDVPKYRLKAKPQWLPVAAELSGEDAFAEVALAWSKEGLSVDVAVSGPFEEPSYPRIEGGDSIELFFDTRDSKQGTFNTRFCHHFFFLPSAVNGVQAGEITRFRTEDSHEHCQAEELKIDGKKSGHWKIFIPNHCLVGYNPSEYDRLGFTYRINRADGSKQHFSVCSDEFLVDQQPTLWSSLRLVE